MGDYGPFQSIVTQKEILLTSKNPDGTMMDETVGQTAWDRLIAKPADINPLILEEIKFCLEKLIFGTDMISLNAYYLLRCLIRDYKVDPNCGIKE